MKTGYLGECGEGLVDRERLLQSLPLGLIQREKIKRMDKMEECCSLPQKFARFARFRCVAFLASTRRGRYLALGEAF